MTYDEEALDYPVAERQARLRQKPLEDWTDMEIVMAALYEYAVEGARESFSMEALLRVEAELERLREENERLREENA